MPFIDMVDENGVVSKIEWTPLKEVELPKIPFSFLAPETFGEEVERLVCEWYSGKGMPVPLWELQACRKIDKAEEALRKKEAETPAPVAKPIYGTPEFWKDWWAKKKAREKTG